MGEYSNIYKKVNDFVSYKGVVGKIISEQFRIYGLKNSKKKYFLVKFDDDSSKWIVSHLLVKIEKDDDFDEISRFTLLSKRMYS